VSKPCTCGGSNENCVLCYGRGFTEKRHTASTGERAPFDSSSVVKCPACAFEGTQNDFTRHFIDRHGSKKRQGQRIQVVVDYRHVCCLTCRKVISTVKFDRHTRSHRDGKFVSRPLAECSICGERVRPDRLDRHMRKVHCRQQRIAKKGGSKARARASREGSVGARTGGKADALDVWKGQIQAEQSPFPPNLDATKPYAHAYREHGKFGSHPSHDGFDDESGA